MSAILFYNFLPTIINRGRHVFHFVHMFVFRNNRLWTPLDCAAAEGWTRTATILLNKGSPVDPLDKSKVGFFENCCSLVRVNSCCSKIMKIAFHFPWVCYRQKGV